MTPPHIFESVSCVSYFSHYKLSLLVPSKMTKVRPRPIARLGPIVRLRPMTKLKPMVRLGLIARLSPMVNG